MCNKVNKYSRTIKDINGARIGLVDVYSVLNAFKVDNSAVAHAIKKLLVSGKRGHKTIAQDLKESIQAIERALLMLDSEVTDIEEHFKN